MIVLVLMFIAIRNRDLGAQRSQEVTLKVGLPRIEHNRYMLVHTGTSYRNGDLLSEKLKIATWPDSQPMAIPLGVTTQ